VYHPNTVKLSILMPVYNELRTIDEILRLVAAVPVEKEILVIDDGSTDGTRDLLARWDGHSGVRVVLHARNTGKGGRLGPRPPPGPAVSRPRTARFRRRRGDHREGRPRGVPDLRGAGLLLRPFPRGGEEDPAARRRDRPRGSRPAPVRAARDPGPGEGGEGKR